jgi:hypothetical protein
MKFYKDTNNTFYLNKITINKLTCIYCDNIAIDFGKNGENHNARNAAYVNYNGVYKQFILNGKYYGNHTKFTKKSWRKFVRELKLQAFL